MNYLSNSVKRET